MGLGVGICTYTISTGLVSFIADLRNARARELEEKRINKELANIRLVPATCTLLDHAD
jgi:hypothetical protein